MRTNLVTDIERLEKDIFRTKQKNSQKPTADHRVASAISQASSLLRSGDFDKALETIKDARKGTKDHHDLLSFEATMLLKSTPPQVEESRKLARKAFLNGCKKSEVFECWFEAEWLAKNYVGALEAACAALSNKASGNRDWLIRKSAALTQKANEQYKLPSIDNAIISMFEASNAIKEAILLGSKDESNQWRSKQFEIHDQIWYWPAENGFAKTKIQLDILDKIRKLGDTRFTNKKRVLSAMLTLVGFIENRREPFSSSQKNLCSTLISEATSLLNDKNHKLDDKKLLQDWEDIQRRISTVIYD